MSRNWQVLIMSELTFMTLDISLLGVPSSSTGVVDVTTITH